MLAGVSGQQRDALYHMRYRESNAQRHGMIIAETVWRAATSASQSAGLASLGIRQSPRGDSATEPTFGPSGMAERLNCWLKKRR